MINSLQSIILYAIIPNISNMKGGHFMENKRKIISVRVEPDLHKKLKEIALHDDLTLQDYIMNLIKRDLKQRKVQT